MFLSFILPNTLISYNCFVCATLGDIYYMGTIIFNFSLIGVYNIINYIFLWLHNEPIRIFSFQE